MLSFAAALWADRSGLSGVRDEVSLHLDPQALADGFRQGTTWYGLYRDGEKVGYSRTERHRLGEGYVSEHTLVLPVPALDGLQTITIRTELDASFTLSHFTTSAVGGPLQVTAEGRWEDGVLHVVVLGLPGGEMRQALPMTQAPQMDQSFLPLVTRDDLVPGDRFSFTHFDPLSASPSTAVVEVMGYQEVDVLGEQVQALHIRQEVSGQLLDVWVNALGEVLRQTLPGGLTAIRESEAEATWGVNTR